MVQGMGVIIQITLEVVMEPVSQEVMAVVGVQPLE
jgi:hypothetical protein